ncbi:MAG TPA: transposase, partial [Nitrospirae bacterium]|nr:transposase [Nitrospirota bacterium]
MRTGRGPRQRDILNIGVDFDLPKEQWKDLANCVEEILTGQTHLIDYPVEIRRLAGRYAKKIIRRQADVVDE